MEFDYWKCIHSGMDKVNHIHRIKFDLRNGKIYKHEKAVPELEKIDKIVLKSVCVEVRIKNAITFEEASNYTFMIIHENGISLSANKNNELVARNEYHEEEEQQIINIDNIE